VQNYPGGKAMKKCFVPCLLILLLASSAFCERFALLVGNSNAKGNYAQLKYVQNDITRLQFILSNCCGFSKNNILLLNNMAPEELDHALAVLAEHASKGTENLFLFYYSGHADENGLKMGNTDYPLSYLKQKLTAFPTDIRIGIIDACQSGSFTQIKGGKLDEPFLFKDDSRIKGQVILSSSSVNENAQESDALGNSIFTFHLINALRGSGDASGDGRVTLTEAYQYAYNHTISSTAGSSGGIQHPSYQFKIQGEGDIVLADLNISSQGIMLNGDMHGDITILNSSNSVVADLTKDAKSQVMIALTPGPYQIINGIGNDRFVSNVTVENGVVEHITPNDFTPATAMKNRKKGEPWDKSVQVGLTFCGAYGQFDLSSLATGLAHQFDDYNNYGIHPHFEFAKRKPFFLIGGDVTVRSRFIGHVLLGNIVWTSSGDYTGARENVFDNKSYGYLLNTKTTADVFVSDIGTGYRFQEFFFKKFLSTYRTYQL
jgi:hypothetical protein